MTAEDDDPIELIHDFKLFVSTRDDIQRLWGGFSAADNGSGLKPQFDLIVYGPMGTTAKYMDFGYITQNLSAKVKPVKGYQKLLVMNESHMKAGASSKPIFIDKSMAKLMIEGLLAGMEHIHQDPVSNIVVGVETMAQALPDFMQKSFVRRSLFEYLPKVYPDLKNKLQLVIRSIPQTQIENGMDMKNKFFSGGKLIELPEFVFPVANTAPAVHLDW